jgi:hypothetical protein
VLPVAPYVTRFEYLGDTNFRVLATGETDWDGDIAPAEALLQMAFDKLVAAGTIDAGDSSGEPLSFPALETHVVAQPLLTAEELRDGFYQRQYALQELQSTFWTGGAWSAPYSMILWEYNNQYLLPKLVASLEE